MFEERVVGADLNSCKAVLDEWTMRMIRMSASVVCCWCANMWQRSRLESSLIFQCEHVYMTWKQHI